MYTVYLFGTWNVKCVPDIIRQQLINIVNDTQGDVEFMVGDGTGIDSAFQQVLASIGLGTKTKIWCMEKPRNNLYEMPVKQFETAYNEETQQAGIYDEGNLACTIDKVTSIDMLRKDPRYFEFKAKEMCRQASFGICVWDKESKDTLRCIDRLKAQNKYVYIYTV